MNEDTVGGQEVSVLDLADIADYYVADADLSRLALPDHAERVLALDPRLQATELPFLRIVVKCRYQDHYDN